MKDVGGHKNLGVSVVGDLKKKDVTIAKGRLLGNPYQFPVGGEKICADGNRAVRIRIWF